MLPRIINNRKVYFFNTCPFDTITEVVSTAYCNSKKFQNFVISQKKANCFLTCVHYYAHHKATAAFYKFRTTLLHLLYPLATNNITTIPNDIGYYVAYVVTIILKNK